MTALVTIARIKALCPHAHDNIVIPVAKAVEDQRAEYRVVTAKRVAHFMAQVAHESAWFTRLTEDLSYSAKRIGEVWPRLASRSAALAHNPEALANAAYGGRLGNGDEATGDGWKFRGRGLIQITGRDNYLAFGAKVGVDLERHPDVAADPVEASRLALAYWNATGCNDRADFGDVEGITRRINGSAMQGIADRQKLTTRALTIFV